MLFCKKNFIRIIDNSKDDILNATKNMYTNKKQCLFKNNLEEFRKLPSYYTHSKIDESFLT